MCVRNCMICPNLVAVTGVTVGTAAVELAIPYSNNYQQRKNLSVFSNSYSFIHFTCANH